MRKKSSFQRVVSCLLILAMCIPAVSGYADPVTDSGNTWILENNVLRTEIEFTDAGSIRMNSFYNKAAGREYLPQGADVNQSTLFRYNYRLLEEGETGTEPVATTRTLDANDGQYVLGTPSQDNITMLTAKGESQTNGQRLEIPVTKDGITVTLSFEIYNDNAGLKYQTYIKNGSADKRLQITSSEVIKLDFPDEPRNLHYVYLSKWYSTTGGVDHSNVKKDSEDIKVVINRYDTGDGFYIGPEVNSKTQSYRRDPGESDTGIPYMTRAFAGINAFKGDGVKVATNPEALKLVLFPGEEFEYIAVNMTVFKGDIADAKMAVEEHLRARFQYNYTSTILNTNDWEWGSGKRNEQYYKTVAVPKAKEAGFEMVMYDDGWNNANDEGTSRDGVEALPSYTGDMKGLAEYYRSQGLLFGLWYSMSGGYHNRGNDLADPAVLRNKKDKIEYMIENYHLSHQMVDLTEFWLNDEVTAYSHPTDNIYRKNVLTQKLLNEVVDRYPDYKVKYTTEVDIWPSQGDRTNELLHVIDNGWTTSTTEYGESLDIPIFAGLFGHMPLNSVYFNLGNMSSGNMSVYYKYMFARNVKHGAAPDTWSQANIDLMAQFNSWRQSDRIRALTDTIIRPVYNGKGWDSNVAANWDQTGGPYVMMHVSEQKDQALMIATGGGKTGPSQVNVNLRWLDPAKQYLIEDITLDDTGVFAYRFKGLLTGEQLKSFTLDLDENTSKGKAYWIEEYRGEDYQILYADQNIDSYHLTKNEAGMIINATGKASGTGKAVIYGGNEQAVMVVDLNFDASGNSTLAIKEFEPTEDVFIPTPPSAVTYVAADLYDAGKTAVNGGTQSKVNSGSTPNASPQGGVNFTAASSGPGSYIEYTLNVAKAGVYNVQAAAKVSPSRGSGQWYIDGVKAGTVWDQKEAEKIRFHDLGTFTFDTPGAKVLRFEFQGGANRTINTDRIVFTPMLAHSGLTLEAEKAREIAPSSGASATIGADSNASGGAYVAAAMPNGPGDSLSLTFDVDKSGTYDVVASHKVHLQSGTVQLYINGEPVGEPYDQYENTANSVFRENNYGTYTFAPGVYTFKFAVVGKNEAAENYNIAVDAIKLSTRQPGIKITGGTGVAVGKEIALNAEVLGLEPFYSTGQYVKWIVVNQASENGANKVISINPNGLECRVEGINPGTARLKAISTVDAKVSGYMDITVAAAEVTPPEISSVVITGNALNGQTLKAEVVFTKGDKEATAADFEYQWLRNGVLIEGETKAIYQTTDSDIGQVITVSVIPVDSIGTKGRGVVSSGLLISRLSGSIVSFKPEAVTTHAGEAPELPTVVTAVYEDGTTALLPVLWDSIDPVHYEKKGQFEVYGDVEGSNLRAMVQVTVYAVEAPVKITDIVPVHVTTVAGTPPVLPTVVSAVYEDGRKMELPVIWNTIEPSLYNRSGSFVINGIVKGTDIMAVANITVTAGGTGSNEPNSPPDGYGYPFTSDSDKVQTAVSGTIVGETADTLTVTIDREQWFAAAAAAQNGRMVLRVPADTAAKAISIQLPVAFLLEDTADNTLTHLVLSAGRTSAELPLQALKNRLPANTESLEWLVTQDEVPEKLRLAGGGAAYQFELRADGKRIPDLDGMPLKLAIAYSLNPGENPEQAVVYAISGMGDVTPVARGLYDTDSQAVTFRPASLGTYAVIYKNTAGFQDIGKVTWARNSIEALAAREVVTGVTGSSFVPAGKITRAEFTALLIRSFGIEEGNANATGFADVKAGAWHSGYITAAQSLGIISGQGNGQFGPNEEISRQDMVVMIYNTIQAVGVNLHFREGLTGFKDEAAVSGYAVEAIQRMQQAGIINGSADGYFIPHNQATRAEAAVIIYNLIQVMK